MKELSVEQKARRYDEAKYIMKKYLESGNAGVIAENTIKNAFPELSESEDERIRKEIVEAVELHKDFTQERKEYIFTWLEKQGNANKEYWRGYGEGKQEILDKYAELGKQGEQNPVDKIQLGKKYKCIASPRYSTFMIGKTYKPEDKFLCSLMNLYSDCFELIEDGEQKPAYNIEKPWSEEDEAVLDALIRRLKGDDVYVSPHLAVECLKSLKDKVQPKQEILEKLEEWLDEYVSDLADVDTTSLLCSFTNYLDGKLPKSLRPQPRQEWSEEDEYYRNIILFILNNECVGATDKENAINWFKSIKHHSQWKPSDEQIEAIKDAIEFLGCTKKVREDLKSLYEQLKKLREE